MTEGYWLARELEHARREVELWPKWLQREAGIVRKDKAAPEPTPPTGRTLREATENPPQSVRDSLAEVEQKVRAGLGMAGQPTATGRDADLERLELEMRDKWAAGAYRNAQIRTLETVADLCREARARLRMVKRKIAGDLPGAWIVTADEHDKVYAERDALAAENERLRAAARDYLAVTNHVVGPRYVVDARMALARLAGAAGAEGE